MLLKNQGLNCMQPLKSQGNYKKPSFIIDLFSTLSSKSGLASPDYGSAKQAYSNINVINTY